MFTLTGRIYGGEKTVTEVYVPTTAPQNPMLAQTLLEYGIGVICRVSPYRIGLNGDMRIPLRRRPARNIVSVASATGATIDPSHYYISTSSYLTVDSTVPTMMGLTVEYTYGTNPPDDGVSAARALADELVMLMGGGADPSACRLRNVTSFQRQGVSFEIEDARTILTDGRTGIPEVDLFVASVNPGKAKLRSRVLSPDSYIPR
jgi:hypothetical protein